MRFRELVRTVGLGSFVLIPLDSWTSRASEYALPGPAWTLPCFQGFSVTASTKNGMFRKAQTYRKA